MIAGLNCTPYEHINFTEKAFESIKEERQQFYIEYFAFGLPWLKLAVCLFGVVSNILNILVLSRAAGRSPINIQLGALELINLILFTTYFYEFAMFYNEDYVLLFSSQISLIATISYCIHNTCVCVSNWLTVSVGIFRYMAVAHPFKSSKYSSKHRGKISIALITLMSVILWFYYYLSFECLQYVYEISNNDQSVWTLTVAQYGNWRNANLSVYFRAYFPIAGLLNAAVPCTSLGLVTIFLIVHLWKAKSQRRAIRSDWGQVKLPQNAERRITVTLTAMIAMYFVAYLPDSVVSVLYYFYPQTYIEKLFICKIVWSGWGILFCNSLTIFFYYTMSKKLRDGYRNAIFGGFFRKVISKCRNGFVENSEKSDGIVVQSVKTVSADLP